MGGKKGWPMRGLKLTMWSEGKFVLCIGWNDKVVQWLGVREFLSFHHKFSSFYFFLFITKLFKHKWFSSQKIFSLKIFNHKTPLPCCPPAGQYPQASSSHLLLQVPLQLYMTESVHWKIICLLSLFCLSNEIICNSIFYCFSILVMQCNTDDRIN